VTSERVAVVTDSTADLPTGLVPAGLRVVPLPVRLGARSGFDGVDVGPADVAAALRAHETVTTSRPTPSAFEAAYRSAFEAGAERVVSVHLSAELSGTWDSARLAAQEFDYGAVRVVDSRSTAMGLGFAVLAAARAAAEGGSAGAVQDAAVSTVDRTSCFFYVDTLEYLRRGGRIGAAQAFVGTALSVKPLLHMRDGRVVPLEKVRTAAKAIARLLDVVARAAGNDEVDVAVQHLAAPERAGVVASALRERLPGLDQLVTSEVAAAVGVHTGPGTVGVVVRRH
jgi:DegV family protein with EDD domain